MIELYGYRLGAEGITFLVALLCAVVRFLQNCWHRSKTTSKDLVFSVLNGASIFPFCLMIGGLFSQAWLDLAVSSKLSMAIAGFVGLLFVMGEVISPESLRLAVVRKTAPAANDEDIALLTVVDDMQRAMSDAEKAAVKQAKVSKRLPKEIDGKLLKTCRRELARDLRHSERVAARKRLLDSI